MTEEEGTGPRSGSGRPNDTLSREESEAIVRRRLEDGAKVHLQAAKELTGIVTLATEAIVAALEHGQKVLLFGNGGSGALAEHVAADLLTGLLGERSSRAALSLSTSTSLLTALGNDLGFDAIFAEQIRALGDPGDIAVGITTSGSSQNVIAGMTAAANLGLTTISLTGEDSQALSQIVDIAIRVPSSATPRIQEVHLAIGHAICQLVAESLLSRQARTE